MTTIDLINDDQLKVNGKKPRSVTETMPNWYMVMCGLYTVMYYHIVDGKILDVQVD